MPRMLPAVPAPDVSVAERRVFEALAAQLPDDWVVLHSRRVVVPSVDRRPPVEGEADFLVLDPKRGCVVLEVKGGADVGVDAHGWYSIDSRGQRNAIKEPAAQAQRVMHTMMAQLSQRRGFPFLPYERRMGWGVVFPDFEVQGDLDAGLPRPMLLDRADLLDCRTAVERMFEAHGLDQKPMGESAVRFVIDALAPFFLLARPLSVRIGSQEAALLAMTDEQVRVMEACEEHPRLSVRGPAGSGKTMVAMALAERAAAAGASALLLCFNAPLARRLALQANGYQVRTFHALLFEAIERAGLSAQLPASMDKQAYEELAPRLGEQALAALPDLRFQAVILDEAQDFRPHWWRAVELLLRDPQRSRLFAFWDPYQDLHGGGPPERLGLFGVRLDYNCRNTRRIAGYAAAFSGYEPKFRPQAPLGDPVERIGCRDAAELCSKVGELLARLVDQDRVPPDEIVVLSPLRQERSGLGAAGAVGRFRLVDLETEAPGPDEIRFSTVHRFKGLEAAVVLLCDVDAGESWSRPETLHVGASRARHYLCVLGRGADALGEGAAAVLPSGGA